MPDPLGMYPSHLRVLFEDGAAAGLGDGDLLERFASRGGPASELAFAAIVERHGAMVLHTCRAILLDEHDARDASQATFLALVRKAGTLRVGDSLGPWLHRVACRASARVLRESRARLGRERRAAEAAALKDRADADRLDLAAPIHEEIELLPRPFREAVILCDLEGCDYEEAARRMGCALGTVKSRLARGRARLRTRLERRGLAPASGGLFATEALARLPAGWADRVVRAAMSRVSQSSGLNLVRDAVSEIQPSERAVLMMFRRTMVGLGGLLAMVGLAAVGFGRLAPGAAGQQATAARPAAGDSDAGPKAPRPSREELEQIRQNVAELRAEQDMADLENEINKDLLRDLRKQQVQRRLAIRRPRPKGDDVEAAKKDDMEIELLEQAIKELRVEMIHRSIESNRQRFKLLDAEKALEGATAPHSR